MFGYLFGLSTPPHSGPTKFGRSGGARFSFKWNMIAIDWDVGRRWSLLGWCWGILASFLFFSPACAWCSRHKPIIDKSPVGEQRAISFFSPLSPPQVLPWHTQTHTQTRAEITRLPRPLYVPLTSRKATDAPVVYISGRGFHATAVSVCVCRLSTSQPSMECSWSDLRDFMHH